MVTLCTDTPKQIAEGRQKHGAQAIMLSDRDLAVTRQYGIENTARKVTPPGIEGLPIPTTILTDAKGTVRWIDQAADYTERSRPDRVLSVIREALG